MYVLVMVVDQVGEVCQILFPYLPLSASAIKVYENNMSGEGRQSLQELAGTVS